MSTIKNKNLKMELLNSDVMSAEEMSKIMGGAAQAVCTKTGDTIVDCKGNDTIVLCMNAEVCCPKGYSQGSCPNIDIVCPTGTQSDPGFQFTPLPDKSISAELNVMNTSAALAVMDVSAVRAPSAAITSRVLLS